MIVLIHVHLNKKVIYSFAYSKQNAITHPYRVFHPLKGSSEEPYSNGIDKVFK